MSPMGPSRLYEDPQHFLRACLYGSANNNRSLGRFTLTLVKTKKEK